MLHGTLPGVLQRTVRALYRRLGNRYGAFVVAVGAASSSVVAVVAVLMVSTFYEPPVLDVLAVAVVAALVTSGSVALAGWLSHDARRALEEWRDLRSPTPRETVRAWETATTLTFNQYRRSGGLVNVLASVPTAVAAVWLWDLGLLGLVAMVVAAVIPGLYATVLTYALGEWLMRPVVEEVAAALPDDFELSVAGIPVRKRIGITATTYATLSAVLVAGLLGIGDGGTTTQDSLRLIGTVALSLLVGMTVSFELTRFLGHSVIKPLDDVRSQLARVREEDFAARVPVLSNDELGELALDFNRMAAGLAERERLRDAFGTYVDREVAELIVADGVPREGFAAEVSVLFVDVRGFTTFADGADPEFVVETLNRLFAQMVPVVEAYGGHVDKFLGDGLMAVFGTPREQADHADRAVAAARMIVDAVGLGDTGLAVGAGVNSGKVVAGPIGGAGRLNFSVIGDVVNVAARVEAATRRTGDDVLVTAATRDLLTRLHPLEPRGEVELKGKAAPVEVYALVVGDGL